MRALWNVRHLGKEANKGAVLRKALLQHTNISGPGQEKHLLNVAKKIQVNFAFRRIFVANPLSLIIGGNGMEVLKLS